MAENPHPPIFPLEPALLKAIDALREYAAAHPESRAAALALDGIIQRLIDEVFTLASFPPGSTPPVSSLVAVSSAFPESPLPYLFLSKVLVDRGAFGDGLKYADAGLAITPEHPGLLFNRSRCLHAAGSYEEAIAGFKKCLEADPENLWALNNIGDAYRSLGLYDLAEGYLKMAIARDKGFTAAYYNLAMLYMDQRDWLNCLRYARAAERKDPTNKEIQLALGDACMGLKDPTAAIHHLGLATFLDRDFVEAYETLASAYAELGMHELSAGAAREALRLNPQSWQALASLGIAAFGLADREQGFRFLLDALDHSPDRDGEYRICWDLGWRYFHAEDYQQAMAYTDRAIQLKEFPDVELSFNRGLILLAQDDIPAASAAYEGAFTRAQATGGREAASNAVREIDGLLARKGKRLDPTSSLATLIQGQRRFLGLSNLQ